MDNFFETRVYAITGATSGIGEAVAIELAKNGARVLALGRNEEKLKNLIKALDGNTHLYETFDSSDFSSIEIAISRAIQKTGKLSGFIHSAGITLNTLLRDLNMLKACEVININLMCFFAFAKAVCKQNRYEKGIMSVVAMSSTSAFAAPAALSVYSASKAGLNASVKAFAKEYAKKGIRFNAIAPSYVKTPMSDSFKVNFLGIDEYEKRLKEIMPLGEIEVQDIANMVQFLLSDKANKITGECIKISGGGYK